MTDTNGAVLWDGGITTPFGVSLATMGALTQNLMFPGQYRDTETGYDDNWHRTYDPALGRYLQADPIGLAGGLNRYAYVGGNPVSNVDPTGLLLDTAAQKAAQRALVYGTATTIAGSDGPLPFGDALAFGFIIGAEGRLLYNTIVARKGGDGCGPAGSPESDPDDDGPCELQYAKEFNWCIYRKKTFQAGCRQNAWERYLQCKNNGIGNENFPVWNRRMEY